MSIAATAVSSKLPAQPPQPLAELDKSIPLGGLTINPLDPLVYRRLNSYFSQDPTDLAIESLKRMNPGLPVTDSQRNLQNFFIGNKGDRLPQGNIKKTWYSPSNFMRAFELTLELDKPDKEVCPRCHHYHEPVKVDLAPEAAPSAAPGGKNGANPKKRTRPGNAEAKEPKRAPKKKRVKKAGKWVLVDDDDQDADSPIDDSTSDESDSDDVPKPTVKTSKKSAAKPTAASKVKPPAPPAPTCEPCPLLKSSTIEEVADCRCLALESHEGDLPDLCKTLSVKVEQEFAALPFDKWAIAIAQQKTTKVGRLPVSDMKLASEAIAASRSGSSSNLSRSNSIPGTPVVSQSGVKRETPGDASKKQAWVRLELCSC